MARTIPGTPARQFRNENLFQKLLALISRHSGLCIRLPDQELLRKNTLERIPALGFSGLEEYLELLEKKSSEGAQEWNELLAVLTNGESFFFRDRDQFAFLKNSLLPESDVFGSGFRGCLPGTG